MTNTFAKKLRKQQTFAERQIWSALRDRRFFDFKFRRQHPIGPYVVDFYCAEKNLIVELDGGQHSDSIQKKYDETRTSFLNKRGYRVVRFWNNEVITKPEAVLEFLKNILLAS